MFHLDIRFSECEGRAKQEDQKPKDLDGKIYNICTWAFFSILLFRLCVIFTLHAWIVYDDDSRNNKEAISTVEGDSLEIRFSIFVSIFWLWVWVTNIQFDRRLKLGSMMSIICMPSLLLFFKYYLFYWKSRNVLLRFYVINMNRRRR